MTDDDRHAAHDRKAVALAYDGAKDAAPRVVAKGRGEIAEQILRLAAEHGVPVREDADLTSILETLEVDTTIPVAAFAAVAEILAYIYRAERQRGQEVPR